MVPDPADKKLLMDIIGTEKKWIAPKTGAKGPAAYHRRGKKERAEAVQ